MKITDVRELEKTVPFDSLKPGSAFKFNHIVYIKIIQIGRYDSIALFNGDPDYIGPDARVYPLNAEVLISG